jgi:hypothetical protein
MVSRELFRVLDQPQHEVIVVLDDFQFLGHVGISKKFAILASLG